METEYPAEEKLCGYLCTVLSLPTSIPSIPFLSLCHVTEFGFRTQNDVVLSPIPSTKGSGSVVSQLQTLIWNKCVKVNARVLHADEGRVLVLVDVYLPVGVWRSSWQFPKSRHVAASLFSHLSCEWDKRQMMLVDGGGEYCRSIYGGIWDVSDCHVLGCKLHSQKNIRFDLHHIFNSLPSVTTKGIVESTSVKPADIFATPGIWDLTDDILIKILSLLGPVDLVIVAATCHHLRSLAVSVMPSMKLKLFPHQQAAVGWMLQREQNALVLPHPMFKNFSTEDGFAFYVNTVSGEIVTRTAPTIRDFRGGMFCDEPGLGKTITALSLILKTQGKLADPPDGVRITWCTHKGDQRCAYYDLTGDQIASVNSPMAKRLVGQSARRGQVSLDSFVPTEYQHYSSPSKVRLKESGYQMVRYSSSCLGNGPLSPSEFCSEAGARVVRCTRSLSRIKKKLFQSSHEGSCTSKVAENSNKRKRVTWAPQLEIPCEEDISEYGVCNETWVQCDACHKWRKLIDSVADTNAAWFCSMNTDPDYQSCKATEETLGNYATITYFPGYYTKDTDEGKEQNVSFFISVLREHYHLINAKTKKALSWLVKLPPDRLFQMETNGLIGPALGTCLVSDNGNAHGYQKIFQAFGLIKKIVKGVTRWYYPQTFDNLAFDLAALRIALNEPLDSIRLYLSRATLIVVPANLVDHWKTQIQKHVKHSQLRVCIWTDHRKPSAHNLAWDFDIVITTFNRLSAEWSPKKRSPLMQVHWLRVILDEGHTLGSSVNLTNKLQMAISLIATNRWLLTGTPTPNSPDGQLSRLQPMLKFLREETYGLNQKTWETGILRPFEAELEESRTRLLQLLHRCLISARKVDLKTIPPCIRKVTFLNFTEEHARSYNELVVTVRRNILMADWNDPSHVESLLNPKQWKFRTATIKNVRLSCCVAGHIKVSDVGEDLQETMDDLVGQGLDPISEEYALIKYCLQYGGNCLRCKEWCRLPIITPCRHILCLHCVALDREKCTFPGCGNLYEMQTPEIRPENPNPKQPVPKDLIELQPSYKQDDWNPDWQSTSSSKVAYLIESLKELNDATLEGIDSQDITEQPFFTAISSSNALSQSHFPEKVIVFSQFLEHIHVIEQQLTFAGIKFTGLYSPMHSSKKIKSLTTFQHDATCMVLVMDGSAALGLDLSFVSHVFLMEPIWDGSIEEQVISRAHRMGAIRPIHVETLAMRGTIEEQMVEFLQDANVLKRKLRGEFRKLHHEGARPHRSLHDFAESNYLAHLSFVQKNSEQ